jgi:hypothetical protein
VNSSGVAFSRRDSTAFGQFEYWRSDGQLHQKIDEGADSAGHRGISRRETLRQPASVAVIARTRVPC